MSQSAEYQFDFEGFVVKFDPARGAVSSVQIGMTPFVEDLYPAVRSAHWGTLEIQNAKVRVEEKVGEGAELFWSGDAIEDGKVAVKLEVHVTVQESEMRYDLIATPQYDFQTCRTGFCVLHNPDEVHAERVVVTHPDGTQTRGAFPTLISPHEPFVDIQRLEHEVAGHLVSFEFEHEVFEMEDQRNWSDYSYKTYGRPARLPRPYLLPAGVPVHQTVTLTVAENPMDRRFYSDHSRVTNDTRTKIDDPFRHAMTLWSYADDSADQFRSGLVALLKHDPRPLVWLLGDPGDRLQVIAVMKLDVVGIVLADYPTLEANLTDYRQLLPNVQFIAGSAGNFTELNRNRPSRAWDGVAFCASPDVHQTHEKAIDRTTSTWNFQVETARSWGFEVVHLGPIRCPKGHHMFQYQASRARDEARLCTTASYWPLD